MKKTLHLLFIIFLIFGNQWAQNKKLVVGYYNWDNNAYPHSAIDFSNLTHLCHAFIWPVSDGNIDASQIALYPDLIKTAHSKGVKVLVSIGGFGTAAQNAGFKGMVNNAASRTAFIKNLVNFVKTNNYDGADFDWEYPTNSDRANFTVLLTDVRAAFNAENIPLLAAAVPSSDWNGGYDVPKLKDILDWVGIMTYDFTGPWDPIGTPAYHNSALYPASKQPYSIEKSITTWANYGMPKSKICAGMPFYGYLLNAPDIFGGKTSKDGEKALSFNTISSGYLTNPSWEYYFDNTTKNPYLRNTARTQIITFDDTVSTRMKCDYINSKGLAGTIIWKIAQSYNGGKNPLLETVGKHLLKTPVSVAEEDNIIPAQFSLTNYPNPFNPTTTIQYSVPAQKYAGLPRVSIIVYDMLGRFVSVLSDKEESAGIHQVNFDGSGLPSGIYFCKLDAGTTIQIRKIVLSK